MLEDCDCGIFAFILNFFIIMTTISHQHGHINLQRENGGKKCCCTCNDPHCTW